MRFTVKMFASGETTCFEIVDQFANAAIDVLYHEIKLPDAEQCEVIAQSAFIH